MQHLACEFAGVTGHTWVPVMTVGDDQIIERFYRSIVERDLPRFVGLFFGFRHFSIEANVGDDAEVPRIVCEIGEDLLV